MTKYWCYFVTKLNTNIEYAIDDKCVVTFQDLYDIMDGDYIIFYLIGKGSGFKGYVQASSNASKNKKDIKIFSDKTLNEIIVNIDFTKFLTNPVKKSMIIEDEELLKVFNKNFKRNHIENTAKELPKELGKLIRHNIKTYNEKSNDDEVDDEEDGQLLSPPDKKSYYIIPIMIIPCSAFTDSLKTIDIFDRIDWIFEHFEYCKECNITNNNTNVCLCNLPKNDMQIIKNTDLDSIDDIVESYINRSHHTTQKSIIYRFVNEESLYDKCYCIVSRLDEKM